MLLEKVKFSLYGPLRHVWEAEIRNDAFLNLVLYWGVWGASESSRFTLKEITLLVLNE